MPCRLAASRIAPAHGATASRDNTAAPGLARGARPVARRPVRFAGRAVVRREGRDKRAARPQHPHCLVHRDPPVGDQVQHVHREDRAERARRERQPGRVGLCQRRKGYRRRRSRLAAVASRPRYRCPPWRCPPRATGARTARCRPRSPGMADGRPARWRAGPSAAPWQARAAPGSHRNTRPRGRNSPTPRQRPFQSNGFAWPTATLIVVRGSFRLPVAHYR